jgi:hypothetical protein
MIVFERPRISPGDIILTMIASSTTTALSAPISKNGA